MKTVLHHYRFESAEHPDYQAMVRTILANADGRGHWMHCWGGKQEYKEPGTETVELETECVFGSQWNTADGRRVFDWHEEAWHGHTRRGHWLEITPEMAQLRRETLKCGYCGHHYGPDRETPSGHFCTHCLTSEYLKPGDLHLLRLLPVIEPEPAREPLTQADHDVLMPFYVERQAMLAARMRSKQRTDVLEKFEKETAAALAERDGMIWLLDRNLGTDNVIYYSHTGKFCFGWRSPLAPEVASRMLVLLADFPFAYEMK